MRRAIAAGVEFLFSGDPAVAHYPAQSRVSPKWFKLGFPSGYVADMLQNLEVLAESAPRGCPSRGIGQPASG